MTQTLDRPVADPTPPAARTADDVLAKYTGAVAQVFIEENQARQRPPGLTLSGLGGCTKRAAYALAGVDPSDTPPPEEARAATLGTVFHEFLLPRLQAILPGSQIEVPVTLRAAGVEIEGRLDLHDPDGVFEGKTTTQRRMEGVYRDGPYADHELQAKSYGVAAMQAGLPVPFVTWLYLSRATGVQETIVEPFTNRAVMQVIARVGVIVGWAERPDKAPREARGPGLSFACDRCPWLRRCWGPTAKPGQARAQRILAYDDQSVEALLRFLDEASRRRSVATADYEYAKAALSGTRSGLYREWSLRRGADGRLLVRLVSRLSKQQRAQAMREDEAPDDGED